MESVWLIKNPKSPFQKLHLTLYYFVREKKICNKLDD